MRKSLGLVHNIRCGARICSMPGRAPDSLAAQEWSILAPVPATQRCDAAEIVGRQGHVTAVERSPAFLDHARQEIQRRDFSWISLLSADLIADDLALTGFDLAWCRWVASFVYCAGYTAAKNLGFAKDRRTSRVP